MKKAIRSNGNLICPQCKSRFVRFDPDMKKFRCLQYGCGWIEQEKLKDEELKGYDYLSGTFTNNNAFYRGGASDQI